MAAKKSEQPEGRTARIILALRGESEYLNWLKELKTAVGEQSLNELADKAFLALAKQEKFTKKPPVRIKPRNRAN